MEAEFAAAIELVVERILFEELVAAVLESAFAPVLGPEDGDRWLLLYFCALGSGGERGYDSLLGLEACLVDLVNVFPA